MWFGIVGQMGPGMRQVFGLWISPREGVMLGTNVGHPIVTSEEFAAEIGLFPNYFGESCYNSNKS